MNIISKTPMRISFVGGMTDIPWFYQEHGGAVISTAIDKYVTVVVRESEKVRKRESESPLVRECLRFAQVDGVSVEIESDVSATGSGLGASSALTVGLIHALTVYKRETKGHDFGAVPREYLARKACEIEINYLGAPIGKQDQYAAAYGGLRKYEFNHDDTVQISTYNPCAELESSLMLFKTNLPRGSDKAIFAEMDTDKLKKMKALVPQFVQALSYGDLKTIGRLLHQNWCLKRGLNGSISNPQLDGIYDLALEAGVIGGKLLGAGGGGHFLFCVTAEHQKQVKHALEGLAAHVPFRFEPRGTRQL